MCCWLSLVVFVGASYFWLVLMQFILELGLFSVAALVVRWPQPALVRSKELGMSLCAIVVAPLVSL